MLHKIITNYNILIDIIYRIMKKTVVMLNAFKQLKKAGNLVCSIFTDKKTLLLKSGGIDHE